MSNQRYTPEFKDEAARQIVDRGYSVADVSERLGVSQAGHQQHKLIVRHGIPETHHIAWVTQGHDSRVRWFKFMKFDHGLTPRGFVPSTSER